jgi:hypothetical protein
MAVLVYRIYNKVSFDSSFSVISGYFLIRLKRSKQFLPKLWAIHSSIFSYLISNLYNIEQNLHNLFEILQPHKLKQPQLFFIDCKFPIISLKELCHFEETGQLLYVKHVLVGLLGLRGLLFF